MNVSWHKLVPIGEFPHPSGVTQVIDRQAVAAMARSFDSSAKTLVDFDHYSDLSAADHAILNGLGVQLPSEAAGWVTGVEPRDDGLWGQIDWTPAGSTALLNKTYRFLSPVWLRSACETVATGKLRPLSLAKIGLTNEPNIRAIPALANRAASNNIIEGPQVEIIENRSESDALFNRDGFVTIEGHIVFVGADKDTTDDGPDEGSDDRGGTWRISEARYSKGNRILKATSGDGYKTRMARLAEAIGGRYTGREAGYVLSESKARTVKRAYKAGWDASIFGDKFVHDKTKVEATRADIAKQFRNSSQAESADVLVNSAPADSGKTSPGSPGRKESSMDFKAELLALLGLNADATDEAIASACAARKTEVANRAALQIERDTLANRVTELETWKTGRERLDLETQVETDLTLHAGKIANRDQWKAALLANRAETIKLLEALPAPSQQLLNRRDAKQPQTTGADETTIANRRKEQNDKIETTQREFHCATRAQAYQIAAARNPELFG